MSSREGCREDIRISDDLMQLAGHDPNRVQRAPFLSPSPSTCCVSDFTPPPPPPTAPSPYHHLSFQSHANDFFFLYSPFKRTGIRSTAQVIRARGI